MLAGAERAVGVLAARQVGQALVDGPLGGGGDHATGCGAVGAVLAERLPAQRAARQAHARADAPTEKLTAGPHGSVPLGLPTLFGNRAVILAQQLLVARHEALAGVGVHLLALAVFIFAPDSGVQFRDAVVGLA